MQRLFTALFTTVSLALGMALPMRAAMAVEVPAAVPVMAQLLFVQNAQGVEVAADGRTLTLKGLSPTTLFFSDRPVRIAGHYLTGEYLQFWKAGPDSFLKDPPNATLSVFEKGKDELSDVVVTLRNPRLERQRPQLRHHGDLGHAAQDQRPGLAVHRHHRSAVHAAVLCRCGATHGLSHRGLGQRRDRGGGHPSGGAPGAGASRRRRLRHRQ